MPGGKIDLIRWLEVVGDISVLLLCCRPSIAKLSEPVSLPSHDMPIFPARLSSGDDRMPPAAWPDTDDRSPRCAVVVPAPAVLIQDRLPEKSGDVLLKVVDGFLAGREAAQMLELNLAKSFGDVRRLSFGRVRDG
jgi:hypothetical protein